jgi:MerR family transcriptional regulator, light-induced transcriptional regulator
MGERLYRISVVAEMVGLSENLLRAWERRHGILEPQRTGAGYRAYTESDVELLRRVKQLTHEGVSIAEVVPLLPSLRREVKASRGAPTATSVDGSAVARWTAAVLEAARRGQQPEVVAVLDEAFAALSPITAFEQLIVPVQRTVGELWHAGELTAAQEHLVTHAVRSRLLGLIHGAPGGARRHVVCACLPGEDHEIGLLGAALRFRDAGFRVTYVGARTPADQLGTLAVTLKPDLIALSQVHSLERRELKRALSAVLQSATPGTKVVIGGPGAEAHADLVEELGATLVTGDAWPRLLA